MKRIRYTKKDSRGVTTAETVMMIPIFFFVVFGLLQLGQLGIALVTATYAASSIARQAVQDNGSKTDYSDKMEKLLTVGMKAPHAIAISSAGLTPNVNVHACAEITAFPFVSHFLGRTLMASMGSGTAADCYGRDRPFWFNANPPGSFVVHGKATARMNYRP